MEIAGPRCLIRGPDTKKPRAMPGLL